MEAAVKYQVTPATVEEELRRKLSAQETKLTLTERKVADLQQELGALKYNLGQVNKATQLTGETLASVNQDLITINETLLRRRLPPDLDDLLADLRVMPDKLDEARRTEAQARRIVRDAREGVQLAEVNAVMSANGALDGKNETERKQKLTAYLATHADYQAAKAAVSDAEDRLIEAELELQKATAMESAIRNEARLITAQLMYLSGQS